MIQVTIDNQLKRVKVEATIEEDANLSDVLYHIKTVYVHCFGPTDKEKLEAFQAKVEARIEQDFGNLVETVAIDKSGILGTTADVIITDGLDDCPASDDDLVLMDSTDADRNELVDDGEIVTAPCPYTEPPINGDDDEIPF